MPDSDTQLGGELDDILVVSMEQAVAAVKKARQFTDNVEFSPEDAGRSDPDFLCRVLEAVIDAGANTVNIPDTVGYNLPHQFGELIRTLIERVPKPLRTPVIVLTKSVDSPRGSATVSTSRPPAVWVHQLPRSSNPFSSRD